MNFRETCFNIAVERDNHSSLRNLAGFGHDFAADVSASADTFDSTTAALFELLLDWTGDNDKFLDQALCAQEVAWHMARHDSFANLLGLSKLEDFNCILILCS